jgi:hypothetical protein
MAGFDPEKRLQTIRDRRLDFIDAIALFDGRPVAHGAVRQEQRGTIQNNNDRERWQMLLGNMDLARWRSVDNIL